jgi:DNA recombination protein RmuC
MSIELVLTAIGIFGLLAFSFLTWRTVKRNSWASEGDAGNIAAKIARHEERERNLTDEIGRLRAAEADLNRLRASHLETKVALAAAQTSEQDLQERIGRANVHIADRDERIRGLEILLKQEQERAAQRQTELATATERLAALERNLEERKQELATLQERLKTEFQNIATTVLTNATDRLAQTSGESLTNIVTPLKEQIQNFQSRIDTVHTEETTQRVALSVEIQRLAEVAGNLGQEADAFAKALKGDSGMRGNWGEVRLERILQMSGLQRDIEYVVQGGEFNIQNEEGHHQRPDFIILLPEDRHFVLDSKLSLVDFLEFQDAEADDQRMAALRKFLASCRRHVDELASKEYQYGHSINSHELVLMFMPIEGAAALALKSDPTLFEYAWNKQILIVSPGTLFLAMRTVGSIWRYERQNQNAQAIAAEAGKLYDKLAAFVEDLNEVSDKIRKAMSTHDNAMKKLSLGKGNALGRAQKLKSMGVSSKKDIPLILIEGEKQAVEGDDAEASAATRVARLVSPDAG